MIRVALLAAGASRRMRGRDKLLEKIDGEAQLRRLAVTALKAGIGPVAVTLPTDTPDRSEALDGLAVAILPVADAAEGMSASLREAALWAGTDPLMVCPADMPDLTAQDFATMAAAYRGRPLRAVACDGTPGHPVVFPPALVPLFAALIGDQGAREILRPNPPQPVPLPGRRATTDLDTPEDWAAWRASRGA